MKRLSLLVILWAALVAAASAAPYLNGKAMTHEGRGVYSLYGQYERGMRMVVSNVETTAFYVSPDFYTYHSDGTWHFNAMTGRYKVMVDTTHKLMTACPMASESSQATYDTSSGEGAVWVIGDNLGQPSYKTFGCDWNTDRAIALAPIGNHRYQLTLTAGLTVNSNYLNFKFYHQAGWGGEFAASGDCKVTTTSSLIEVGSDGNIHLREGQYLMSGGSYTFILDCVNPKQAVLTATQTAAPATAITINGTAFQGSTYYGTLTQGSSYVFEYGGSPLPQNFRYDPDFFSKQNGKVTFKAATGSYRLIADMPGRFITVQAMESETATATYDTSSGQGAVWAIGDTGLGKPNYTQYGTNWDPTNALCLAQISPKVYQLTLVAGKQLRADNQYVNFKFYHQAGWGGEFSPSGDCRINMADNDVLQLTNDGNVQLKSGKSLTAGRKYVFTLDCSNPTNAQLRVNVGYEDVEQVAFAGGAYRLVNVNSSGKSVFVKDASFDNNKELVVWTETDVPAQQWQLVQLADKVYALQNVYTKKYMACKDNIADGAEVCQTYSTDDTKAGWVLTASEGTVRFSPATDGSLFLTLTATTDGTVLTLAKGKSGTDLRQQQWTLSEVEPKQHFDREARKRMMDGYLAQYLRDRGNNQQSLGGGGGWGDAEMLETVLDAYETSGDADYLTLFEKVFNFFKTNVGDKWNKLVYNDTYKWYGHDFNDDVMWMIIASARAYHLTGNTTYLNYAKTNFDLIYDRALNQWGMMRWAEQSGGKNGTNSCIDGPTEVAACYIAEGLGDESYYTKARNLYEKQRRFLGNMSSGQVYDCFTWDADTNLPGKPSEWASTYNQGTMLGAAVMLYNHYGDEQYRLDADKIAEYSRKNLCNADSVVKVCQTVGGDLCGFKGILMRYLRRYVTDLCHTELQNWVTKSAFHAYNNMNSKNFGHSAWLTKAAEDMKKGDDSYDGQAFGSSTAVSAAFNAMLHDVRKNAYAIIQAEDFDYIQKAYVVNPTSDFNDLEVGSIANDAYLCYSNVDFGSATGERVLMRLSQKKNSGQTNKIELHLDKKDGTKIATVEVPNGDGWKTISTAITPTTGVHNIYLVFKNSGSSQDDNFHLDYMQFATNAQPFASADVTDNGGLLKASASVADLALLTDNNPLTSVTMAKGAAVTYESPVGVSLKGYAIGSGTDTATQDAKTWTLQASNDGKAWKVIDMQANQSFAARNANNYYAVSTTQQFTHFRLVVTENGGGDRLQMSEWQLFGTAIFNNDITANGGTVTATAATDKDASTTANEKANLTVTYQGKGKVVPVRYGLTAPADPAGAPASWTLYASTDGQRWLPIDSRENQVFPYAGSSQFYPIDGATACQYFRLEVLANGGAAQTQLAELQLFGDTEDATKLYNDITKNAGQLTTSEASAEAEKLTDSNAETTATLHLDGGAWIQYRSTIPAQIKAYSVFSGADLSRAPKAWTLQASNDGTQWTLLSSVEDAEYTHPAGQHVEKVNDLGQYQYFRLTVSAVADAAEEKVEIADWQLHGICLSSESLTKDGVTITTEWSGFDNEGADNLNDHSIDTKYCYRNYATSWITFQLSKATAANMYSITTANDNGDRDPRCWTLSGSNDGSSWTLLDQRDGVTWYDRKTTHFFRFHNSTSYKYYRMDITQTNGAIISQMSELQLLQIDDNVPAAPKPTHNAEDVASVYSGAYPSTSLSMTGWAASIIKTSGNGLNEESLNGDKALHLKTYNFVAYDFGKHYDVTEMDYVHIDIFPLNLSNVTVHLNVSNDAKWNCPLTCGQWNSIDIPLAVFTNKGINLADIFSLKLTGKDGNDEDGRKELYLDNIYFWKEPAQTDGLVDQGADASGKHVLTGTWSNEAFATIDDDDKANAYDLTSVAFSGKADVEGLTHNPYSVFVTEREGTVNRNEAVRQSDGSYRGYNYVFDEDGNDTSKHYDLNTTIAPVTVTNPVWRRHFSATGHYATAVLPFAYDHIPGAESGTKCYKMTTSNGNDADVTLMFTEVSTIEANMPYLFYVGSESLELTDVGTVTMNYDEKPLSTGIVDFVPNYHRQTLSGDYVLPSNVMSKNDIVFHKADQCTVNPFRAYLSRVPAEAKVSVFFDDATGIHALTPEQVEQVFNVFTTDGKAVRQGSRSLQGLPKGVYIINGKKTSVF